MILEIINFSKRLSHTVFSNLFGIIIISLSAPLIAIYYDPLQMGEYSLFVSIVAILSYVSIGAIDQILLSNFSYSIDNNIKIFSAFAILNLTTTLIYCISLCVLNIFYNISDIYYFIPLAVFCSAFLTLLQSHFIKLEKMRTFLFSNIFFQSGRIILFIYFGLTANAYGLILSEIFSRLIPIVLFSFSINVEILRNNKHMKFQEIFKNGIYLLKENKTIIYNFLPSQILESAQASIPLYFIGAFFGIEYAGIFGMAQRLITAPIFLISRGLSDILLRDGSLLFKNDTNIVYKYIRKMHLFLITISIIILFGIVFILNPIIGAYLPLEWRNITPILPLMALSVINRISMVPFFPITIVLKKHSSKLKYESMGFILSIFIGTVCYYYKISFYNYVLMTNVTTLVQSCIFFYSLFWLSFAKFNQLIDTKNLKVKGNI